MFFMFSTGKKTHATAPLFKSLFNKEDNHIFITKARAPVGRRRCDWGFQRPSSTVPSISSHLVLTPLLTGNQMRVRTALIQSTRSLIFLRSLPASKFRYPRTSSHQCQQAWLWALEQTLLLFPGYEGLTLTGGGGGGGGYISTGKQSCGPCQQKAFF